MISNPPVVKPPQLSDTVKDRPVTSFDRSGDLDPAISSKPVPESTGPYPHDPSPSPSVSRARSLFWTIFWICLIAGCAAAWHYRDVVQPWVAENLGIGHSPPPKAPPPRIVPVVTAPVEKSDLNVYLNGLGTVTAFKTVTIRSRVEGELVNVAFTEGQMVKEGDLLAEIDRRPFEVQLQQAEGQLARDQATLKSADFTYKRYQELIQSRSISPQQIDEQRALVQQTAGAIQSDLAAVENAKLQLDYCRITAPIGGRIGLRLVDQGNIVRANDPSGLAVITQLQPIALVFTIPQDDIFRVQKPQSEGRTLIVDAFDRDFKVKLATGKLLAIDNQVDSTTGTVRLKAEFDNEDGMLFPNQFVNARLLVDTRRDAVVVPTAAVQRGPSSTFVYVVQPDDTVELRNVTVSMTEGTRTAVESGLEVGEIVVIEGLDKLQPKTKITTREKEQARESGKPPQEGATPPGREQSAEGQSTGKHADASPRGNKESR
ncbi:MdtA/MuxA family multidrug efflux RND transporter periplasmic adaptor subunit [Schlesneria sp.]|uniref:MdtA/MuxA family multidrug efflux RND transporter periplasmic adaptor subunit n=1 Tax=Schlesneria sp. TaxID=2762018 RepID=UPI002EF13ECC